jgi:branched-chain amino acid transport system substrate-binding protein
MNRMIAAVVATAALGVGAVQAQGTVQDTVKVGLIVSQTGPFAAVGRQMETGVRLYIQQNGDTVAGKKIEVIVKDDTGVADTTRRLAQELVVNDKVQFLAGFTLTPGALATAPIATQSKTPMIVMLGATSIIPDRSPYIVRSMLSVAQLGVPFGEWIYDQGSKTIVTLVSDYGPGQDYENLISQGFEKKGGKVLAKLRVPLANPEFAPFLQRLIDLKPDAMFVFVPAGGVGAAFMKQANERGLAASGVKIYTEGSIVEDDLVNGAGDIALGMISSHNYSAAHDSPTNKAFVEAYKKAYNRRPNFVAVAGYDGMHLIYEALKKTNGTGDGDALVKAMIGTSFESPRGPVTVDGETRDMIQNIYVRKTERLKDGELYNVEFATIPNVKDPTRPAKP